MEPYYSDASIQLLHGDCLQVLPELPDNSVDAVVTDPPYSLSFMSAMWDTHATPLAFQAWCQQWAAECLRILKPGGHLLAFGGTRTWHRLTCAIEDAGFEIRDSIAWLYGAGFPKSLDVSKAIDRQRDDSNDADRLAVFLRAHLPDGPDWDAIDAALGSTNSRQKFFAPSTAVFKARVPSVEQWEIAKALLGVPDSEFDAEVWRLNGRKGKPGDAWNEREVVGESVRGPAGFSAEMVPRPWKATIGEAYDLTAPATDAARRWQGWGTALKPGWEIVVHGQKPLADQDILTRIGSWLAQAADPKTRTGAAVASNDQTGMSQSGSATSMNSNTVTSWHNCWAELYEATSTSTTETTSRTTTDLKTLLSYLGQITPESITQDRKNHAGSPSPAETVDTLFAAAVLNSRVTRTLTATESATRPTQPTSPDAAVLDAIVLARKPLAASTVAANVLRYGTGALNIDACRIDTNGETWAGNEANAHGDYSGKVLGKFARQYAKPSNPAGRWPANVALDESQADALDQMSGDAPPKQGRTGAIGGQRATSGIYNPGNPETIGTWPADDGGGASRFFYTAKAGSDERVSYTKPDGTIISHATVKPLSLMRWLVRLVCPPGGTILEPFAGSGTTVEAAFLEGFRCIAIEREADYLPLITQRINRRRDPIAYITAAGQDLGLFGLDDDEAEPSQPKGRWPANVVLDRSQAEALDEMSGDDRPKPGRTGPIGGQKASSGIYNPGDPNVIGHWPEDSGGGASRFFKVVDDDLGDGTA